MFGGSTSGFGFLLFVLPIAAILTQYTITGYDASAHLSEETKSAADGAAKGIWRSIFYSAIGGWILLLSFLFAVQDADGVSAGGGAVVHASSPRRWTPSGSLIVLLISTAGQFFCTTACQTSASRMLFAFSRDRAVPGHQLWSKLSAKKVPANGVMITAVLAAIITLPALVEVDINGAPVPGRVLRGGVDRRGRAVPVLRGADLLPLEGGRLRSRWAGGTCADTTSGWRPVALIEIIITSIIAHVPDVDRAACRGTPASSGSSSTTPRCWSAAC